MRFTGVMFDALADDLDRAVGELMSAAGDPAAWERRRGGHWTVGQHAAHVAIVLERTAGLFEEARLQVDERDRLWIVSPFRSRWHYRLPEMVRMHAVHTRHHARQVAELAGAG